METVKIEEIIEGAGLSEKEAKIYLTLLQLGSSKANIIAKEARLLRSTTYAILKSLMQKGLVSSVVKGGINHFETADPEKLLTILKEREKILGGILPKLKKVRETVEEKPKVELYVGKEGLKTILDDIIKEKAQLYVYANYKIFELLDIAMPQFVRRRIKARIKAKVLQEKRKELIKLKKLDRVEYREMRFLDVSFKSNVFIYGNKTALIAVQEREPVGIIIENKDIADTQRQVFELLWQLSTSH